MASRSYEYQMGIALGEVAINHSLTQDITKFINRYGPSVLSCLGIFLDPPLALATQVGSSILGELNKTQKDNTQKANTQMQEASQVNLEAFKEAIQMVKPREVRVIGGVFNSGPAFTNTFAASAILALAFAVYQGDQARKAIGSQLADIKDGLSIHTAATVQGWGNASFGGHVHRFIQAEIQECRQKEGEHVFYVYHPDTDW